MKCSMIFNSVLLAACILAQASNQKSSMTPISKVLTMLSDLEAKISAEGATAKKEYEELMGQCEKKTKRLAFEIKTGKAGVKDLEAAIAKEEATITSLTTKIEEYAASITKDETELQSAKDMRAKEQADYSAKVKETNEIISTLTRAIAILEREMNSGASMMQLKSTNNVVQALSVMVQASALSSADGTMLTALLQNSQESNDGDEEPGAPAGAVYVSQSGGIVSTLEGLLDKAQEQLAAAQKAETEAIHSFELLAQSLSDSIKYAEEDMASTKKDIAVAEEEKATAEGDLAVTSTELKEDIKALAEEKSTCMTAAQDYEEESASRAEELEALATAKKVIKESTGAAEGIVYGLNQVSFLQLQRSRMTTGADLAKYEAVRVVRHLAQKHKSTALAQLAMRMANVMNMGSRHGEDPFAKVKGLIMDMIDRLSKEADADASKKAYCDKETAETKTAIEEKTSDIEKLASKIDLATANSGKLKEQVATLEKELAKIAKEQAEMDATRQETHATFLTEKKDLAEGIEAVKTALKVLKEYYAKEDKAHDAAEGGAGGVIKLLEVAESDFTKGLSERVSGEEAAQEAYESGTKENEIETATKDKDVEYKTKEAAALDKEIAELTADKSGVQTELDAKNEYLAKLDDMCLEKAETYEHRAASFAAEIAGLKEALSILDGEAMLIQRTVSRHSLRR